MQFFILLFTNMGLQRSLNSEKSVCQFRSHRFNPWVRNFPWRRKWQLTPVFLLGKPHVQRSLVGYSPWGCKQPDLTEWLSMHTHTFVNTINYFWGLMIFLGPYQKQIILHPISGVGWTRWPERASKCEIPDTDACSLKEKLWPTQTEY